jgi:hypothetical protein
MIKIVGIEFIPRLGNGRPENGTGDWSCVAFALPEFDDSGVTAVAIGRARRDVIEQLFHRIFLPQNRERGATSMERTFFAERDHFFRERADALAFASVVLIR